MSVRAVDPARSRIVLVGAPAYDDPGLADVPQVARNLTDLAAVFTDAKLGGFAPEHCACAPPDATVDQIGDLLEDAAEQAEDLLLFYFAGHGLVGTQGELFLALRGTRFRNPAYSALRFQTVRETFVDRHIRAENRVVIVDSCFSGRALGPTLAGEAGALALAPQLDITGTYTLASAPPNSMALVREGEAHTAFTGRLVELLQNGSAESEELISLGEIYRHLLHRMRADGLPLPQMRVTATTNLLGLVRNAQAPMVLDLAASGTEAPDKHTFDVRRRAATLLWRAEDIAAAVEDPTAQTYLWAKVADLFVEIDVGEASRVSYRAEPFAHSITDTALKAEVLARIAHAVAPVNPDGGHDLASEAVGLALSITAESGGASRLPDIVLALVSADTALATHVTAYAEHVADSLDEQDTKAAMMAALAWVWASSRHPSRSIGLTVRAEELADNLINPEAECLARALIAAALAATDPQSAARMAVRAELLADSVGGVTARVSVLALAAIAHAPTDLRHATLLTNRAALLVRAGKDTNGLASPMAVIGQAKAITDPPSAELFTDTITDDYTRANTLIAIAREWLRGRRL